MATEEDGGSQRLERSSSTETDSEAPQTGAVLSLLLCFCMPTKEQNEDILPAVSWIVFMLIYGTADLFSLFEGINTGSILYLCHCLFSDTAHNVVYNMKYYMY